MEIGDAIKQSHFADNYQKGIVNLLYTGNWVRDEQIRLLKQYDILPQHYNILRIIKGRYPEPISPGEIKEVLIDRSNDLTRLLDKLERKGFIKRRLCTVNRRKMDVTLSAKGVKLIEDTTRSLEPFVNGLKGRITDKEAETLSRLLDKIRE